MRNSAVFFIFIICILDMAIISYPFWYADFWNEALIVHALIYIVIEFIDCRHFYKSKGVPNYLLLFLPGVGTSIVCAMHFSLNYFLTDSMVLEEYERYINYERIIDDSKKIDYEKEIRTISFLDQINLLDTNHKKELILEFGADESISKVKLLQRCLKDADIDVKHYSAATLNMIENEFNSNINRLREEYNLTKETRYLDKLCEEYRLYIESGLLSQKILNVFNREYVEVLKKRMDHKNCSPDLIDELVRALIRNGSFESAETANRILIEKHHDTFRAKLNDMHISYARRDFRALMETANRLENIQHEIPHEYKDKLSYWIGEDKKA